MNINKLIQLALQHYHSGNLQETVISLHKVLKERPNDADILYFIGIVYAQLNNVELAIQSIKESLQWNPTNVDAYLALGNLMKRNGLIDDAISLFQKMIALNPSNAEAYKNLGNALREKGQIDEAIIYYHKAIQISPFDADIYGNLGKSFQTKELLDESIKYYQKALQINPNLHEIYANLGMISQTKGQLDKAIAYYQKAIQIYPDFAEAYFYLGNVQHWIGQRQEALFSFDKAIELAPNFIAARWAKCMSQLPIVYTDQFSIADSRKRYHEELVNLRETIPLRNSQEIKDAAEAIGIKQPFYLAYQELNDRELQQIYGDLVYRIMSLRYPQYAQHLSIPSHFIGRQVRVGIVSGFFYKHSVWKLFKGWIQNLNKQQFWINGYYTGKIKDAETQVARESFKSYVEDIHSFEELCRTIRDDKLDVLIYPEIGMDFITFKLASLRLATIQCASWGHPDTSGLPTIDYFLSSDLMEPADGDDHYCEKLIRLPNLSVYYTPVDFPEKSINRDQFGIRPQSILYLCCQSLYKYLPQYDEIYPRIAQRVFNCQFLFISNPSTFVTEQFRLRIKNVFDRFNMNADNYVVFLPRLDEGQYHSMNCLADIYLDSIGWSGGNTTLEAIACNLPVVTIPGKLMRGRHSTAMLRMMGMKDTIAATLDEYIDLAVKLGQEAGWRRHISSRIAGNKHLLYKDMSCITALGDFLVHAVQERL
jgi:protein O-GlcNAc transferase